MMLRCTVFGAISSGELFTAKATFRLSNMRQNFPKSLLAAKPHSISFSANPLYHSMSNLIFCDPLVFRPVPVTGNLESRLQPKVADDAETSCRVYLLFLSITACRAA